MSKRGTFNWWWIIGGVLLTATVAIAVVLNFNFAANHEAASTDIDNDNGDTKINWDKYETYEVKLDGNYNITAPGTYHITGAISDGGISIKLVDNGVAKLILDNVYIKNSHGPAIACYSGDDLVIELVGENYLADGSGYDSSYDEDVNGAIYSKADLTFAGDGALTLEANYQDGIVSKDDLKIKNGTYNIVAKDDGIRGKDSVYVVDGKIDVSAGGDGIKSTNEKELSKGFVLIAGGEINITKSREGVEARRVIVNAGELSIFANDDGINAGGGATTSTNNTPGMMGANENCSIAINGGTVYVNAAGDGIDSNGYLYFNGGSTIVDGPTNSSNGALDAGISIVMNGGTVVAVGASGMAENLGANSAIYNISVFFNSVLTKDTKIEIKDSTNKTIISHTAVKAFNHLAAGSTDFKNGETYAIYINDKEYTTFTISDIVTVIGNGPAMGPGGNNSNEGNPGGGRNENTIRRR